MIGLLTDLGIFQVPRPTLGIREVLEEDAMVVTTGDLVGFAILWSTRVQFSALSQPHNHIQQCI